MFIFVCYNGDEKPIKQYYYQRNMQGDVVAIYSTSGAKAAEYIYDAYGNCTVANAANSQLAFYNPIRYRGYYLDRETGLYYLNARYYNPEWRRFISLDSTEYLDPSSVNGLNLYAYCNNDPVNYADPSGHIVLETVLTIILGVVALAATINDIYQLVNKNVYVDKNYTDSGNVRIHDSYKLLTPWMRAAYSFYLNHFCDETRDTIQGSSAGVQFEWELHNYAAWLGIGGDSAKHLDVGKTLFADGKTHPLRDGEGKITSTGVMSLGMRVLYIMFGHPLCWLLDLLINGEF